jgi:hypothetical protein
MSEKTSRSIPKAYLNLKERSKTERLGRKEGGGAGLKITGDGIFSFRQKG